MSITTTGKQLSTWDLQIYDHKEVLSLSEELIRLRISYDVVGMANPTLHAKMLKGGPVTNR